MGMWGISEFFVILPGRCSGQSHRFAAFILIAAYHNHNKRFCSYWSSEEEKAVFWSVKHFLSRDTETWEKQAEQLHLCHHDSPPLPMEELNWVHQQPCSGSSPTSRAHNSCKHRRTKFLEESPVKTKTPCPNQISHFLNGSGTSAPERGGGPEMLPWLAFHVTSIQIQRQHPSFPAQHVGDWGMDFRHRDAGVLGRLWKTFGNV